MQYGSHGCCGILRLPCQNVPVLGDQVPGIGFRFCRLSLARLHQPSSCFFPSSVPSGNRAALVALMSTALFVLQHPRHAFPARCQLPLRPAFVRLSSSSVSISKFAEFTENFANSNGGAIFNLASSGLVLPEDTTFSGNTISDVSVTAVIVFDRYLWRLMGASCKCRKTKASVGQKYT